MAANHGDAVQQAPAIAPFASGGSGRVSVGWAMGKTSYMGSSLRALHRMATIVVVIDLTAYFPLDQLSSDKNISTNQYDSWTVSEFRRSTKFQKFDD